MGWRIWAKFFGKKNILTLVAAVRCRRCLRSYCVCVCVVHHQYPLCLGQCVCVCNMVWPKVYLRDKTHYIYTRIYVYICVQIYWERFLLLWAFVGLRVSYVTEYIYMFGKGEYFADFFFIRGQVVRTVVSLACPPCCLHAHTHTHHNHV